MIRRSIAISAVALALAACTRGALAQYAAESQPREGRAVSLVQVRYAFPDGDDGYGDFGEYAKFRDRGFRDGFAGARKDFENHRFFTPMNRDEYRHPDDVPREAIRTYRIAFREGYLRGEHEIEEHLEGR